MEDSLVYFFFPANLKMTPQPPAHRALIFLNIVGLQPLTECLVTAASLESTPNPHRHSRLAPLYAAHR